MQEMRQQRRLLTEHLAWLDREIVQAEAEDAASPSPETPPTAKVLPQPLPESPSPGTEPNADALLAKLAQKEPTFSEANLRLGCILSGVVLTALPLALLFGLPYLIYFTGTVHHLMPAGWSP